MIHQLGEEVKTKDALQAMLNERKVADDLRRQNLDVSISVASVSISDNSRLTGVTNGLRDRKHLNKVCSQTSLNQTM